MAITPQGDIASVETDGRCVRLVDLLDGEFKLLANLNAARRKRLQAYQKRLHTYQFSVILIQDAPIDVATEIFTRINVSGQPLSVFEIMVAKTYDHETGFDLAERYKALRTRLEAVDYGTISPPALLQLAGLLMVGQCQKQDILRLNTTEFRKTWPRVEDAVESACDYFRSYFRIPVSKLLPYAALIVPFGYYFAKSDREPRGEQRKWMRELFWRISLSGRYTGRRVDVERSDFVFRGCRRALGRRRLRAGRFRRRHRGARRRRHTGLATSESAAIRRGDGAGARQRSLRGVGRRRDRRAGRRAHPPAVDRPGPIAAGGVAVMAQGTPGPVRTR